MKKKKRRTLTQTAIRLSEEDFEILDKIRQGLGIETRSAAIRYLIRRYKGKYD